jgi:FkbM family methyltransferase
MENRHSKIWGNRDWQWVKTDYNCWEHMHKTGNGPDVIRDVARMLPKEKRNLVIQAGGNCGMFPVEYDRYFQRVVTFEPDPLNFKCLVANMDSKSITPIQACLGAVSGKSVPMRNNGKNIGACHVSKAPPTFHALTFAIDDLNVKPDVIHLDVEGYELQTLLGAEKTIQENRPIIVSEIKQGNRFLVWEYLREFSYIESSVLSNGDYVYETKR